MTAIDPTSTFPTSVDTFPTIVQNDDEAAAGKEHWLLHNKQSNAIRSAQTRILSLISQGLASQWRNGTGAPSNGLGVDGDYYLNNANGDVYFRASGTYSIIANLKGPQGIQGITGPTGSVWRTGAGVPSNGTGVDNDYYLNTTNGDVYKRVSGAYALQGNIKGATGATTIPTGGTTGQLVAKASNTDFDITFVNAAALSNTTPLPAGAASAGTSVAASRSDHSHPPQAVAINDLYEPTGTLAKTFGRLQSDNSSHACGLSSGNHMVYAIPIPANTVVTTINFRIFTQAVTPTHQWAGLFDPTLVALAFSIDHTTTLYTTDSTMNLALTAPITTGSVDALYYISLSVVAGTMPLLYGRVSGIPVMSPRLNGNVDTGMTAPPALPYDKSGLIGSLGQVSGIPYAWIT